MYSSDLLPAVGRSSRVGAVAQQAVLCSVIWYTMYRTTRSVWPQIVLGPSTDCTVCPLTALGASIAQLCILAFLKQLNLACRAQYFQPPEALDGCKPDMKSNVHACGMLMYELLLRKEPYQDDDPGVLPCPKPPMIAPALYHMYQH